MVEKVEHADLLHHIITNYEGDPNDPKWKAAQDSLKNLAPQKKHLHCPHCKILHVDQDKWATTPHCEHTCKFCRHQWKPHVFPTFGIGVEGMLDSKEATAFLGACEGRFLGVDELSIAQDAWIDAQKYWLAAFRIEAKKQVAEHNRKLSAVVRKTKMKLVKEKVETPEGDPDQYEVDQPEELRAGQNPQIVESLQNGTLDFEDVVGLGLDTSLYSEYANEDSTLGELDVKF